MTAIFLPQDVRADEEALNLLRLYNSLLWRASVVDLWKSAKVYERSARLFEGVLCAGECCAVYCVLCT